MLMLSLNQADTRLAGKLSLVSFDAAKNMADSMKREGIGMLAGNISQSVLQLGLTGVGAKFGLKGLKNEKLALRQNTAKMTLTNDVKGTGQNIKDNLAFNARRQGNDRERNYAEFDGCRQYRWRLRTICRNP